MGDYYDASYEIQCPVCRGTKYRNPQMKLMVNVCGHPLCDSCVRMYFIKGEKLIFPIWISCMKLCFVHFIFKIYNRESCLKALLKYHLSHILVLPSLLLPIHSPILDTLTCRVWSQGHRLSWSM